MTSDVTPLEQPFLKIRRWGFFCYVAYLYTYQTRGVPMGIFLGVRPTTKAAMRLGNAEFERRMAASEVTDEQ